MKKIALLIICLLLVTGCQAEYNIEITSSKVLEEVIITGSNTEEVNNLKQYKVHNTAFVEDQISSESNEKIQGVEYYEQKFNNNELSINYDFNKSDYIRSNIVNSCYQHFNYTNKSNNYTISTSKEFSCFNIYPSLDAVTVNIKVDFDVTEHNADSVNGNTYTWKLSRNSDDNSIYVHGGNKIQSEDPGDSEQSEGNTYVSDSNEEDNKNQLIWVLCGLGIFFVVLFIVTRIKKVKE